MLKRKFSTENQGLPGLPGLPSLPGLPACQNLLKMKFSTKNQGLPGLPGLPKCKKSQFGPTTSLICNSYYYWGVIIPNPGQMEYNVMTMSIYVECVQCVYWLGEYNYQESSQVSQLYHIILPILGQMG